MKIDTQSFIAKAESILALLKRHDEYTKYAEGHKKLNAKGLSQLFKPVETIDPSLFESIMKDVNSYSFKIALSWDVNEEYAPEIAPDSNTIEITLESVGTFKIEFEGYGAPSGLYTQRHEISFTPANRDISLICEALRSIEANSLIEAIQNTYFQNDGDLIDSIAPLSEKELQMLKSVEGFLTHNTFVNNTLIDLRAK
ncbi:hypothetical protein [Vibrio alginolyticus]|uniref:hypothetical protein n=1 Tax=Vibrio TaxID=662 RepID=UPI0006CA648D|nr:hypothetical protein [Vibrio alginolyticus]KPM98388.1 hypothetical protein AOG25_08045 [Vibrio alginolyticus]CAH7223159.1 conserved hypothetical protein [Vibrio chagasii]